MLDVGFLQQSGLCHHSFFQKCKTNTSMHFVGSIVGEGNGQHPVGFHDVLLDPVR